MIRIKTILLALLGLMLLAPRPAKAQDEAAALATFNHSVESADPRQVEAAYRKDHPAPPPQEDMDRLVKTMSDAALNVMDQANQFEKQFPQSKELAHVHDSMVETLTRDFGLMGLPVPKARASDLEAFVRNSLKKTPNDAQLYMTLVRVAQAMPTAQSRDLYVELSGESIPEPARGMARQGLSQVERVGSPLKLSFTALDGRPIDVADFRGKVVLVDFWSTTCVPCVAEMPGLKQLYQKYHPNGFEIIGVSLDSDKAALTRFVEKEKMPWPQFFEPAGETNRLATQYNIKGIPVLWLVDKHGILRQLDARYDQEKKVEALLKE